MAREKILNGIAVAPGISIAPAYLYTRAESETDKRKLSEEEVGDELLRLEDALVRSERQLEKIASVARDKLGNESAEIFEAQRLMLRDDQVHEEVIDCIQKNRCSASHAVQTVMQKHRRLLEASTILYWKERAHDLLDVQDRILHNLNRRRLVSKIDHDRIVVAKSLTAADVILFSRREIRGCLLDYGGATSHVSIVSRALGVPAVVSVGWDTDDEIEQDQFIILDGFTGRVILNPTQETIDRYRRKQERYNQLLEDQKSTASLPSQTVDGRRVALRANIDVQQELSSLEQEGAEGIGLLRTEMIYLLSGRALSEDEQFHFYKKTIESVAPHPTTIRLIDLGGDKLLPMGHHEHNPFLGWRGVRILLDKPELLQPQLRAVLRSAVFGSVRLMIPMVTRLGEVIEIRKRIEETARELEKEGTPFSSDIPLGIMVEVPAVALQARAFAREVDFFSIGTNDLTQYTLAVDRGNDLVSGIFDEFNPAILRLISETVEAAREAHIPVSICGELAAHPEAVPLLVGLGIDELSASPVFIPLLKRVLRHLDTRDARILAQKALVMPDANAVHTLINDWFNANEVDIADLMH